jgi:futalosine hydrolase
MIPDICTMDILLAAATTFEIQPAIDALRQARRAAGLHRIQPLITGVGGTTVTWSLMRQIGRSRPDLIIQAGIAGSLRIGYTGKVVAVREDEPADLGVWEDGRFQSIFDMNLANGNTFPFTGGRLVNPHRELMALTALESVGGLTVNEITTNCERIAWLQQNTRAVVESMEGAPFHFVCLQENIPFLQLRAVSNEVGERDKSKWEIRTAIDRLNGQLLSFLDNPQLDKTILS